MEEQELEFTDSGQRVLDLAQEEATRLNHNFIGTEHILLGLIRDRDSIAIQALTNLRLDPGKVRQEVEFFTGGKAPYPVGITVMTPRAKKVIELAIEEARNFGQESVDPEHILLGLVREGEGIAWGVLTSFGATFEMIKEEITRLKENPSTSTEISAATRFINLRINQLKIQISAAYSEVNRLEVEIEVLERRREFLKALAATKLE